MVPVRGFPKGCWARHVLDPLTDMSLLLVVLAVVVVTLSVGFLRYQTPEWRRDVGLCS